MRFLVDQQLPPALTEWLRARGHEAEHVRNVGLRLASRCTGWRRLVTKDKDFAARRSRDTIGPTIIWLRIGNSTTPHLKVWLEEAWPGIEAALQDGMTLIEVR